LNKSHFQTIGGNNISKNLGVLHFLLTLAKLSIGVFDDFTRVNWPNTDQDGFSLSDSNKKSDLEIQHNFFIKAYTAYNNGNDEFDQEVNDLYWDLMDSKQVNEELIAQLEDDMIQLEQIHQNLKQPSNEIDELTVISSKLLDDIKGLQDYLEKAQKHFNQKQLQLKNVQGSINKLNASNDQLKQSILMLESECLAKNIDPKDTSNHAQEFVQTLHQRVELKKAEINEADKLKWKYEQSLSKKNATVDKLKHEFNKMLINFNNVEEATNLREVMDQPSLVLKMINDLKQDLRVQQSNLDGDLNQLQLNLCEYKQVLASKEKELNHAKEEEMEKKKVKTKLLEKIKNEEDELKKKLEMAQKKLKSHHGEKNRISEDLKDKEKQLQMVQEEKKKLEADLQDCKIQGEELIKGVMEDMKKRRVQLIRERDFCVTKYEDDCKRMSEKLKNGISMAKMAIQKLDD